MNEVASVDEHKVVFFFLKERETMKVTVARSFVFPLYLEVDFWKIICVKFFDLLFSHHYLYFQI